MSIPVCIWKVLQGMELNQNISTMIETGLVPRLSHTRCTVSGDGLGTRLNQNCCVKFQSGAIVPVTGG